MSLYKRCFSWEIGQQMLPGPLFPYWLQYIHQKPLVYLSLVWFCYSFRCNDLFIELVRCSSLERGIQSGGLQITDQEQTWEYHVRKNRLEVSVKMHWNDAVSILLNEIHHGFPRLQLVRQAIYITNWKNLGPCDTSFQPHWQAQIPLLYSSLPTSNCSVPFVPGSIQREFADLRIRVYRFWSKRLLDSDVEFCRNVAVVIDDAFRF